MRWDTAVLIFAAGAGTTLCLQGLYSMLITRGYMIAIELAEAGVSISDLRKHQKAASVLPWIQRMGEPTVLTFKKERQSAR